MHSNLELGKYISNPYKQDAKSLDSRMDNVIFSDHMYGTSLFCQWNKADIIQLSAEHLCTALTKMRHLTFHKKEQQSVVILNYY